MITASELLEQVLKLAEDKPDTRSACQYFDAGVAYGDGTPCCIVGHALDALGVDVKPFLLDSDLNAWTSVADLADVNGEYHIVSNDGDGAVQQLHCIQARQDAGDTWGEAIEWTKTHIAKAPLKWNVA